jgi:hypothetical protein
MIKRQASYSDFPVGLKHATTANILSCLEKFLTKSLIVERGYEIPRITELVSILVKIYKQKMQVGLLLGWIGFIL